MNELTRIVTGTILGTALATGIGACKSDVKESPLYTKETLPTCEFTMYGSQVHGTPEGCKVLYENFKSAVKQTRSTYCELKINDKIVAVDAGVPACTRLLERFEQKRTQNP